MTFVTVVTGHNSVWRSVGKTPKGAARTQPLQGIRRQTTPAVNTILARAGLQHLDQLTSIPFNAEAYAQYKEAITADQWHPTAVLYVGALVFAWYTLKSTAKGPSLPQEFEPDNSVWDADELEDFYSTDFIRTVLLLVAGTCGVLFLAPFPPPWRDPIKDIAMLTGMFGVSAYLDWQLEKDATLLKSVFRARQRKRDR